MPLNPTERRAVSGLLSQLDHDTFKRLLLQGEVLPEVHIFSALTKPMPFIAVDFVLWLDKNSDAVLPALEAILSESQANPAAAELSLARERIRAAERRARQRSHRGK